MSSGVLGFTGKVLRVDLRSERITEESPEEATLRKYLGGTGLGSRPLYAEVAPGIAGWLTGKAPQHRAYQVYESLGQVRLFEEACRLGVVVGGIACYHPGG